MSSQFPSQYIICRDKLPTQVTVTHGSLDAAKAEAERLARKQNDRFMVFELIGVVGPTQPPWPGRGGGRQRLPSTSTMRASQPNVICCIPTIWAATIWAMTGWATSIRPTASHSAPSSFTDFGCEIG